MQNIKIQLADNGVIKSVHDDNINGAGESFESTVVYEFKSVGNKIKFIEEICIDIGLELGNSMSKHQINIQPLWGSDYNPSDVEIEAKIQMLTREIEALKQKNE